jgi:hypothetical protein
LNNETNFESVHIPCRLRALLWQQLCAFHPTRIQQDNGGSLPSYKKNRGLASPSHVLDAQRSGQLHTTWLNIHLVVEDLGLARLGLWDERLIQDIEDILADFLEFGLNLLTVVTDGANVLVRAL